MGISPPGMSQIGVGAHNIKFWSLGIRAVNWEKILYWNRKSTGTHESKEGESMSPNRWTHSSSTWHGLTKADSTCVRDLFPLWKGSNMNEEESHFLAWESNGQLQYVYLLYWPNKVHMIAGSWTTRCDTLTQCIMCNGSLLHSLFRMSSPG